MPQGVKLWLTKGFDNRYLLTYFKPLIERIYGTKKKGVYLKTGEPVGVMGLCEDGIKMLLPKLEMKEGESIRVELSGMTL